LINRSKEGGRIQRAAPPALELLSHPKTPQQASSSFESDRRSPVSPVPRKSMDSRLPSFTRVRSRTLHMMNSSHDLSSAMHRQASSPSAATHVEARVISPKLSAGLRIFQSSGKGKEKWKGISSADYDAAAMYASGEHALSTDHLSATSGMDLSPGAKSTTTYTSGQLRPAHARVEGLGGEDVTEHLSMQMNKMSVARAASPGRSAASASETSAFDKMLRDSAKEDAARLKEIASRTIAQAPATATP
jgi:hypothetical protein